jgi:signal transduction histidine kinase
MVETLTKQFYDEYKQKTYKNVDRLFIILMIFQWITGIVAALIIAPKTWIGNSSSPSMALYMAVILGALTNLVPAVFAFFNPGEASTRQVIAIGQGFTSSLLIHLSGGRIETHFHVFGSLAFLAAYRDTSVLMTATSIIAADHFIRGVYYPQSVFGVSFASSWRWLEHTVWVIFEDIFLIFTIITSHREMRFVAKKQAELHSMKDLITSEVQYRTKELQEFNYVLAHELRSSLNGIDAIIQWLQSDFSSNKETQENIMLIKQKISYMKKLISSLLEYSRISLGKYHYEKFDSGILINKVIKEFSGHPKARFITAETCPQIYYHQEHFYLILKFLVENALFHNPDKDITVNIWYRCNANEKIIFYVSDNGVGIAPEHHERIFRIFQKLNINNSTHIGFSLSLVKKIVEIHGGELFLKSDKDRGAEFSFTVKPPLSINR